MNGGPRKTLLCVGNFGRDTGYAWDTIRRVWSTVATALEPRGVAVLIDSEHQCISTRGVHKTDVSCVTQTMTGVFRDDPQMEARFFRLIG